ncbi:MAG: hypothetical protein KC609_23280 [Myxococcales bacterium]|nr:hypothetical protein [Myxococcales bacterium]
MEPPDERWKNPPLQMKKRYQSKFLPLLAAFILAQLASLSAATSARALIAATTITPPGPVVPSLEPAPRSRPTTHPTEVEPLGHWIARQLRDARTLATQQHWSEACEVYVDIKRRAPKRHDYRSDAMRACIEATTAQSMSIGPKRGFPPRCSDYLKKAAEFGANATTIDELKLKCGLAQTRWRIDDALHVRDDAGKRRPEYQFSLWKRIEKLTDDTRKAIDALDPQLRATQSRRLYARALALNALAQTHLANYRGENRRDRLDRAKKAITQARTLSADDPLVRELRSQVRRRVWGRTAVLAAVLALLLTTLVLGYLHRRRSERRRVESFMSPDGKS